MKHFFVNTRLVAVVLIALLLSSPVFVNAQDLSKANIEKVLNDAYNKFKDVKEGAKADYIKELATVDPNIFGIAGLREGIRYLLQFGVANVLTHERMLLSEFYGALKTPDTFEWYGADRAITKYKGEGRVGLLSLNLPGLDSTEVGAILDSQFSIAVRAGLHCAPLAHRHLGTSPGGTVRLSMGLLTTVEDVRSAADALSEIALG